jgi:flagellar basal-body rod protein FlgB
VDPARTGPVALAERRLGWLEQRQRVLAQNIANADTPHYRARDLAAFDRLLRAAAPPLARTEAGHLQPAGGGGPRPRADRAATERTPNGNAVALDEQALKIADTDSAHALATGLHRRYLGMFRTALGRN